MNKSVLINSIIISCAVLVGYFFGDNHYLFGIGTFCVGAVNTWYNYRENE